MIIKAYKNDKEIDLSLLGTLGYCNSEIKVDYRCDKCGNIKSVKFLSLRRNNRLKTQICQKCIIKETFINGKKCGGNNKFEYEYIKEFIEKEGYTLLDSTYEEKSNLVCPKGHKWSVQFTRFKNGTRCFTCSVENRAAKRRKSYTDVKEYIESQGYKLLSESYENVEKKLKIQCNNNHIFEATFHNFKDSETRCPDCSDTVNKKHSYEFIKERFKEQRYTLLSDEYNNSGEKLSVKCPENHVFVTSWHNFRAGNRCPKCYGSVSKAETDVYNFIKQFLIDAVQSNRSLIKPFELDIVIPSKKIAIEYNGLYYHSESMGKNKNYHLNKLQKCNEIGYKLITIFEDEWINKQNIVKHRLMHILNVSEANSIHARKCVIKEINATVKNEFLNKFHIQGADRSSIKLGAFYNDQLVSLMTFSKGSIAKGGKTADGIYELNRFCSDHDYIISGIANRLFKHFIRNYNPTEIFTYGDKRWSDGNLYKHLGFDFVHDSAPNYWYIDGCNRIHRFNFRKSVLKDKLEIFDESLSEIDNMRLNGWDRIWDCGNVRWSYNNTKD